MRECTTRNPLGVVSLLPKLFCIKNMRRTIYIPDAVCAQIFGFIHPTTSYYFLYLRGLYRELCAINKQPRLPLSALISMNDIHILEKFKNIVLSFRFRQRLRFLVAQFGSVETIQWCLSNDILSWDKKFLKILAGRGELDSIKLLVANGSFFTPKILFNAGRYGWENIIQCNQLLFMLEGKYDHFPFNEKYTFKFLEYSARGNQLNVTLWMLRNYPSEMVKNAYNMIFGAVKGGHIEMLEWIKSNLPETLLIEERKRYRCIINAARNKNLNILQWLQGNGFSFGHRAYTQAAAFSGNLSVLQYMRKLNCPWSYQVCNIAAKQGNLEMLQWAKVMGCPWKIKYIIHVVVSRVFFLEPCFFPIEKRLDFKDYDDHLELDDESDDSVYQEDDGDNDDDSDDDDDCDDGVLYQFNPDLLQWVLDNRKKTTDYNKLFAPMIEEACDFGNLDILMWMRENKPDVMDNVVVEEGRLNRITESALLGGHLPVVEWLEAQFGEALEWTAENCIAKRVPKIFLYASKNGHLNVLQWARSRAFQLNLYDCLCTAIRNNRLHVLIWLKEAYFTTSEFWCVAADCKPFSLLAAEQRNFDIFQWVHSNGCPWSNYTYATLSRKTGYEDWVEWALKNGCSSEDYEPSSGMRLRWRDYSLV